MFHFSTDSLMEYEQDSTETPIILERIHEEKSDYIIPTVPNQSQLLSIQNSILYPESESESESEYESEYESDTNNEPAFYSPESQKIEDIHIIDTPKIPFIMNIYVGSLTVVGLFLIFRLIQK